MSNYLEQYLPRVTRFSQPFWDGLKQGKFQSTRCRHCQGISFPPHSLCPDCFSDRYEWVELKGRAILYSFTLHEIVPRAYIKDAPYITAMVDLEEGPRILCRLKEARYEDLIPGMSLKVGFGQLDEKVAIFYFVPAER